MANKNADQGNETIINCTIKNISSNNIFISIRNKIHLSWQHSWESIHSILLTNKLKSIKDSIKQWYTLPEFSRRQDIDITRTRIEDIFQIHSFFITKDPSTICNTCQTSITIKHIFVEFPRYELTRFTLQPLEKYQRNSQ